MLAHVHSLALCFARTVRRPCCVRPSDNHSDFPLSDKQCEQYLSKYLVYSVLWAFGGSLSLKHRLRFSAELLNLVPPSIPLPDTSKSALIDFEVRIDGGDWSAYEERVDVIELEARQVVRADVVIDTVDTARHTDVINSWLTDHRPLILCGPPGSGHEADGARTHIRSGLACASTSAGLCVVC